MSSKPSLTETPNMSKINPWWIAGFVDGEGCFSVSFIKNDTMRFGYQIFAEFVVTQGEKSLSALELIKDYFDCGKLYCNRRHDNHQENLYRYCVRNREDLTCKVIPFFEKYPLLTAKSNDYGIFAEVVGMMNKGEHLTEDGFAKIQKLAAMTNRRKSRI